MVVYLSTLISNSIYSHALQHLFSYSTDFIKYITYTHCGELSFAVIGTK